MTNRPLKYRKAGYGIAAFAFVLLAAEARAIPQNGKDAYLQGCASCHASGLNGAPKVGEHAQWGMLIGMGKRTLYKFTIEGRGSMPARGGTNWPDATIRAAVDYMVELNK
jgi:cytochrome c5